MKPAVLTVLLLALSIPSGRAVDPPALDVYAELLSRYVTPAGVRYDCWRKEKRDVKALAGVVEQLSLVDASRLAPVERRAHGINLYNATVLKLVVEGELKSSIRELSEDKKGLEIFDRPILVVAGSPLSLTGLEKVLREEGRDPRVHFAINCAARSCPPLQRAPFRADALEIQLERAAREFLASKEAVTVERDRVAINRIFEWYRDDFGPVGSVAAFIKSYAPAGVFDTLKAAKFEDALTYREYDWSLNADKASACQDS